MQKDRCSSAKAVTAGGFESLAVFFVVAGDSMPGPDRLVTCWDATVLDSLVKVGLADAEERDQEVLSHRDEGLLWCCYGCSWGTVRPSLHFVGSAGGGRNTVTDAFYFEERDCCIQCPLCYHDQKSELAGLQHAGQHPCQPLPHHMPVE